MESTIILIIGLLTAIVLFIKNKFNYWNSLGVTQFKVDYPHGNVKGLGKKFHISELLCKLYQKTKLENAKFSGIYLFLRPIFFVVDLDIIKTIMVKDFNIFPNRGIYFSKHDPISAHMFNLENEPWRALRHKISPTFTTGKIKMMFATIDEVALRLLNRIDTSLKNKENCIEIKDLLARFTTDVIGSTAFGIECNSLENPQSEFYIMGTKIFATPSNIFVRFLRNSYKDLARALRIKSIPEDISKFYMGITKQTVEYREKNPQVKRQDFMNLLVEMKKDNIITIEQIAAQSFLFFLAGYETSSSTMTYCMYELSINEEIQQKARQSVMDVLHKHDNKFTYDSINDMHYLEQCVNETLRKYPVVANLIRTSVTEYKVPGTKIILPKNQLVWIPVYAIHHDAEIYPDPEKFDPDRFSPKEVAKRHDFSHLPFGEGQRICIGMRFGIVEAKLGLARLLMNYKFTLDRSKTPVPLELSPQVLVLAPKDKIFIKVEKL